MANAKGTRLIVKGEPGAVDTAQAAGPGGLWGVPAFIDMTGSTDSPADWPPRTPTNVRASLPDWPPQTPSNVCASLPAWPPPTGLAGDTSSEVAMVHDRAPPVEPPKQRHASSQHASTPAPQADSPKPRDPGAGSISISTRQPYASRVPGDRTYGPMSVNTRNNCEPPTMQAAIHRMEILYPSGNHRHLTDTAREALVRSPGFAETEKHIDAVWALLTPALEQLQARRVQAPWLKREFMMDTTFGLRMSHKLRQMELQHQLGQQNDAQAIDPSELPTHEEMVAVKVLTRFFKHPAWVVNLFVGRPTEYMLYPFRPSTELAARAETKIRNDTLEAELKSQLQKLKEKEDGLKRLLDKMEEAVGDIKWTLGGWETAAMEEALATWSAGKEQEEETENEAQAAPVDGETADSPRKRRRLD